VRAFALPLLAAQLAIRSLAQTPASIVRIPMPPEASEGRPVAVPSEPENTVELDFPWPVADWAGRGFTPDPEKFAGDFVIEASRGSPRLFVTPVSAGAHRVLDVVLASGEPGARSLPVEFVAAPPGLAWRKVIFEDRAGQSQPAAQIRLDLRTPPAATRRPSPESEIGLIRTMRAIADMGSGDARALASANPALSLAILPGDPRSFGDFTIALRFALRDATTGSLGICAAVANQTARRLLFDPAGWIARSGDRAYPVATADFPGLSEPGSVTLAFLVVASGPDGRPTRLLADSPLELSARIASSASARPVIRRSLEADDE
jgi:hypothetical protein